MGVQEICEGVVRETEGILGCLVFDLRHELTVASAFRIGTVPETRQVQAVLRFSQDMFRGKLFDQLVGALAKNQEPAGGCVCEAHVNRVQSCQFFAAVPGLQDGVVLIETERSVSVGIGWLAIRHAQQRFSELDSKSVQDGLDAAMDRPPELTAPAAPDPLSEALNEQIRTVPPIPNRLADTGLPTRQVPQDWERGPSALAPAADPVPMPPSMQEPDPGDYKADPPADPAESGKRDAVQQPAASEPERKDPVVSGPRAKMFKSRRSRKKKAD